MPTYTVLSMDEFKQVARGPKRIAVIFYADWCGNSQQMLPLFRQLSDDPAFSKAYDFFEIECDLQPDILHYCGISMLPHMVLYKNQEKLDEVIGSQLYNKALQRMLKRNL